MRKDMNIKNCKVCLSESGFFFSIHIDHISDIQNLESGAKNLKGLEFIR